MTSFGEANIQYMNSCHYFVNRFCIIWQIVQKRLEKSYLHESCQVWVVIIQGGNNVELNLDQDALAQVVLVGDGC